MSDDENHTSMSEYIHQFPKSFWIINSLELIERGAYYGTIAILAIHLHDNLGFSASVTGILTGTLMALLYFVPLVAAALAEKIGYRKSLIISFFFMISGYLSFGFFSAIQLVFLSIILLGIGAGAFKPLISATIAHVTEEEQRNAGFSIYYWMINLGAFMVPLVIAGVKSTGVFDPEKNSEMVFFMSSILITINLIIAIFKVEEPITPDPDKDIFSSLRTLVTVFNDKSFMYLLIIYSGFWFMFGTAFIFMPLYMRHFHIMPEWFNVFYLATLNPGTIISVGFILSKIVEKYDSLHLMITGVSIFVIGVLMLGLTTSPILFVGGIIIFSIGEFITHPNFISYVSKIAPKDKVAVYMGYAFIPAGIGQVGGSFIGGFIFGHFAETSEMPKIFWAIIASYGLITIAGLILYDNWMTRMKKIWAEEDAGESWDEESWDHYEEPDRKPSPINVNLPFITESKYGKFIPAVVAILLIPILIGSSTMMGKNTWYETDDDDDERRMYSADVHRFEDVRLDETVSVDEGESFDYNHNASSMNVLMMEVEFSWDSSTGDVGEPDVRLEVWTDDASRDPIVEEETGFSGSISVQWFVNLNENLTQDSFTMEADSRNDLYEMLETEFYEFHVLATYVDANNPAPFYSEPLDFTLRVTRVDWELVNVEKVWSS